MQINLLNTMQTFAACSIHAFKKSFAVGVAAGNQSSHEKNATRGAK
jgi:hypothetical protein